MGVASQCAKCLQVEGAGRWQAVSALQIKQPLGIRKGALSVHGGLFGTSTRRLLPERVSGAPRRSGKAGVVEAANDAIE